jgi:hypothetical protein
MNFLEDVEEKIDQNELKKLIETIHQNNEFIVEGSALRNILLVGRSSNFFLIKK